MRFLPIAAAGLGSALMVAAALAQTQTATATTETGKPAAGFETMDFHGKLGVCLACHGEGGVSHAAGVPNLAGEPDLFVEWQLVYFRGDTRKNAVMNTLAHGLSDDDIRALGAYFAALPAPPASKDKDPELTEAGAKVVESRHCAQCHTDHFAGQGEIPRLAGQREEFIVTALHDYQHGARRGRGNVIMPEIAYSLNEDDIHQLAHFMSVQGGS